LVPNKILWWWVCDCEYEIDNLVIYIIIESTLLLTDTAAAAYCFDHFSVIIILFTFNFGKLMNDDDGDDGDDEGRELSWIGLG
jgi:hypothetical protein